MNLNISKKEIFENSNINIGSNQHNPSHLVDRSPWPALMSFSLFSLVISAVSAMQGYNRADTHLLLSFIIACSIFYFWCKDVSAEGTLLGHHTKQVKKGIMIGVVLFIISEAFAFLSIFWAWFHSALVPAIEIGSTWPPLGITPLDPFAIPLLNTFLLLSSGAFITYGHHAFIGGARSSTIKGFIFTIILALIFTALQYFEYQQSDFSIADSVFGSTFFCSTGLHGLHVIIGTIFIWVGFMRIVDYQVTRQHHQGIEASILYWHFVDVVWLFLFIAVYFWPTV